MITVLRLIVYVLFGLIAAVGVVLGLFLIAVVVAFLCMGWWPLPMLLCSESGMQNQTAVLTICITSLIAWLGLWGYILTER